MTKRVPKPVDKTDFDKTWLLPPNMRAMARFMNLRDWVEWSYRLLHCYDNLENKMKEVHGQKTKLQIRPYSFKGTKIVFYANKQK